MVEHVLISNLKADSKGILGDDETTRLNIGSIYTKYEFTPKFSVKSRQTLW
ncbi:MAG UNVERIFIED_CONTAM: hypothetical protein LVQ98_03620 [Rickettsiaceae bacterium]